ncbi:hypothetical protein D6D13_10607, partial [Aureobasidium pullulans]
MANEGIAKAGLAPTTLGVKAIDTAAVQASGDYLLLAKDAATAERLNTNGRQWVECRGSRAEKITPTFKVMVMNVPVTTFNPEEQEQMRQMLIGQNYHLLADHKVNHMDLLPKPKPGQVTGTMVISFMTKAAANAALFAEVIAWEGQPKRTIRYSKACRVLQHKKCTLCKGNHPPWAQIYKYRQQEMGRVEAEKAKVRQQPYYPEDSAISSGISGRGFMASFVPQDQEETMTDAPIPAEAASIALGASQIASSMSSQAVQSRNQNLSSILKKTKTPQRTRATAAAKTQITGMTPLQVKRRTFGQAATRSPQEEMQCEPGSDVIEV